MKNEVLIRVVYTTEKILLEIKYKRGEVTTIEITAKEAEFIENQIKSM